MVYGGSRMTKESIFRARDYLRVRTESGCRRIVDITSFLQDQSRDNLIPFLQEQFRTRENELKNMIQNDKTHPKVDRLVSAMFRITMAIKTLEEGKEVIKLEKSEQGTEKCGQIYRGNRSGHRRAGQRENSHHGGENRVSGEQAASPA